MILPLPSQQITTQRQETHKQADRARPPNNRRAHEVILELRVAPATHPQPKVQEGPVKGF